MTSSPQTSKNIGIFERFASAVTKVTGSTGAFVLAFLSILVWGVTGPIFHYSEDWQLVINTGTSIITLNELIAAHEFASNRLVNVENMTEDEMKTIQKYYAQLSILTKKEESLQTSHSIDEAENMSEVKKKVEADVIKRLDK